MSAYQSDDYDEEDVILFERHIVIWWSLWKIKTKKIIYEVFFVMVFSSFHISKSFFNNWTEAIIFRHDFSICCDDVVMSNLSFSHGFHTDLEGNFPASNFWQFEQVLSPIDQFFADLQISAVQCPAQRIKEILLT